MNTHRWPGNWKVICDICGFEFFSGEVKHRWDGLIVCEDDWETRHPQTLIKVRGESSVPSFVRSEPEPTYTGVCSVVSVSAYSGLAAAGCMQAGNNTVPYDILRELFLNGHED